ncbi:flagellar hook protein FlgE [Thalassobius sp. Cn5-15]|uniref:flagellar hook protein FlgE n=1 Tax=Thalassobius sp. Cn5-15 TaxID=2917763 RepID=UPI001EF19016|nr:flagellar hook protein FlgE [Thalassobius sp. Cn5-15]MCG7492790.1 flagellar hook protein FlgE [Thalassobius sp. Cn5-15]
MSSFIALSGLNAAQADLTATSNNIANVNTGGFRASRTEFSDLFTRSPYAASRTAMGSGVRVQNVRQSFSQGAVSQTADTLDLAIQGQGFFTVSDAVQNGNMSYTRAGAFGVDQNGYIVNAGGGFLQGFPTNMDGSIRDQTDIGRIRVPSTYGEATQTTIVDLQVNLQFGSEGHGNQAAVPSALAFDPTDDTTYASTAPINVMDDEGNPVNAAVYFVRTADPTLAAPTTSYEVRMVIDGETMTASPASITFDDEGNPSAPFSTMNFSGTNWNMALNLDDTEMSNQSFSVESSAHNGDRPRGLSGLEIGDDGLLWASYAGDRAIALGQLAIGNFSNLQGLKSLGDASYAATNASGDVVYGAAGSDGLGNIESGALELSNVSLTSELVDLITAQRNYQASAKALETSSSMAQTIMNIRA